MLYCVLSVFIEGHNLQRVPAALRTNGDKEGWLIWSGDHSRVFILGFVLLFIVESMLRESHVQSPRGGLPGCARKQEGKKISLGPAFHSEMRHRKGLWHSQSFAL